MRPSTKCSIALLFVLASLILVLADKAETSSEPWLETNEIDDRIQLKEPYKSVIQGTIKVALSSTKLPEVIKIDTAMKLVNQAGTQLSKPRVLIKTLKAVTVIAVGVLMGTFLFPGAMKFMERAYKDPVKTLDLDRFINRGKVSERSFATVLTSQTDNLLNTVGLGTDACRQKAICYIGAYSKCSFPETSKTILNVADEFLSNPLVKDNKYVDSFMTGFRDEKCDQADSTERGTDCLDELFRSLIKKDKKDPKKTQILSAARA